MPTIYCQNYQCPACKETITIIPNIPGVSGSSEAATGRASCVSCGCMVDLAYAKKVEECEHEYQQGAVSLWCKKCGDIKE